MPTQEIPREEWSNFFDSFNRQHEGWLASLEVFGPEIGAQEEAHELPFEGVTMDSRSKESGIAISLGNTPEDHVTRTVVQPSHVWLEQTDEGANAALEIESSDESKTLLRFRSPVPPEFVDGAVMD
jgi:hypothetical protein